jgi:hippurate hydrolase
MIANFRFLIIFLTISSGLMPLLTAAESDSPVDRLVEKDYAYVEQLYIHLHAHPELSFQEEKTSARLAAELRQLNFEVTEGVGGFGVVAVLRNGEGPTVMLRADMDALPVKEETGLPYASTALTTDESGKETPVMHACGHDMHMSCLIGTARTLHAMREQWHGTLVAIAQPAEERGAGARAMLADGLFTRFPRPDYALALHVSPVLEVGKVSYIKGYAMANVDSVDIKVRGTGGHGAYPHMTKDPVVLASQIVLALQTIVSRELSPTEPAVVTVGSIHGGTKHNVIPNEVDLQLTVRSYSDETRSLLLSAIERIALNTARSAGIAEDALPIVTVKDEYTPATYNDPELVDRVMGVIGELLGEENVNEDKPKMGGEDFGRYGREEPRIPIFMMGLGTVSPERFAESKREGGTPLPSLHSSRYAPDREATIKTGIKVLTAAILDLMQ